MPYDKNGKYYRIPTNSINKKKELVEENTEVKETEKQNKKFYQKKRYIITPILFIAIAIAIVSETKTINKLVEECNQGQNEKCDELLKDWVAFFQSKSDQDRISNPYLIEKFKNLNEKKEALNKKFDDDRQKQKTEKEEIKRRMADKQKRYDVLLRRNALCKIFLKKNMKDPRSFRELNSVSEQLRTGIIRYSATNSFGGRIQSTFDCNK
tara:strand:+ start:77 stop:706 length:630 start_codon:yes stop_codon:yes gene_type:complete